MIYRVQMNKGYDEAFFDFDVSQKAVKFAEDIMEHKVNIDGKKVSVKVTITIIDQEVEDE